MGRRGLAGPQVNLLRVVELLQTHITPALCHAVFGQVRRTERQRVWTLDALVRFWTVVILRAPTALSQALADARDAREPLFPQIEATPEAFFQRCRDLRPAFFAEVFRRFTARLVNAVPPRYAAEVAPICQRFADVVILDGSRLAAIAHRLKLLWNDRASRAPSPSTGRSSGAEVWSRPAWDWGPCCCGRVSWCWSATSPCCSCTRGWRNGGGAVARAVRRELPDLPVED